MYWLVLDVFGKSFASADVFFSPETKLGSEIMRKILNFASFEAKKFSPRFASKRKLLHRSETKNYKNRLEFRSDG